jgi:RNA polymerase sigma-70 factor (ECF subfamily)
MSGSLEAAPAWLHSAQKWLTQFAANVSHVRPEPTADADLPRITRAQAGELAAFDEIVGRHQERITALLFRICPTRNDLEDLVQETFVRAYRHLDRWRPEKPFAHWLKRIATNVGLEYCRRNRRSPLALRAEVSAEAPDPLDQIPAAEESGPAPGALAEAQWLLSHLAPNDRALLTLLYLDEMPLAEIAEHFGWSRANAKIRAFRARAHLRKILEKHGYTYT